MWGLQSLEKVNRKNFLKIQTLKVPENMKMRVLSYFSIQWKLFRSFQYKTSTWVFRIVARAKDLIFRTLVIT